MALWNLSTWNIKQLCVEILHPEGFVLLNVVSSGKFHINLWEDWLPLQVIWVMPSSKPYNKQKWQPD